MIITLIGFPASGKTKLGKALAEKLDYKFLDTDELIEKNCKEPLQHTVNRMTRKEFQELEENTILSIKNAEKIVISTGGSAVYSKKAMEYLREISKVVYLKRSFGDCYKKIMKKPDRGLVGMDPNLSFKENLKRLYEERYPLYMQYAHIIFQRKEKSDIDADKLINILKTDK